MKNPKEMVIIQQKNMSKHVQTKIIKIEGTVEVILIKTLLLEPEIIVVELLVARKIMKPMKIICHLDCGDKKINNRILSTIILEASDPIVEVGTKVVEIREDNKLTKVSKIFNPKN